MKLSRPNYRAWLIDESDFPRSGTLDEKIRFLVGYGILAPSQHNTQPWVVSSSSTLDVTYDARLKLPAADPDETGIRIALGAFIENVVLAAKALGLSCDVHIKDDRIKIAFRNARPEGITSLSDITKRRSAKELYSGKRAPASVIASLRAEAMNDGVESFVVDKPEMMRAIEEIHLRASEKTAADVRFVRELLGWLRANNTRAYDGMPGFVSGLTTPQSIAMKLALKRKPQLFRKAALRDKALLDSAALLVVWCVNDRDFATIIDAGRCIERLWVHAVGYGLAGHPMVASVSDMQTREDLRRLLGTDKLPIFMMRFGYTHDINLRTPRRMNICK